MAALAKYEGPNACRRQHMTAACNEGMHRACLQVGMCAPTDGSKPLWMRMTMLLIFGSCPLISMQRGDDPWQLQDATMMTAHAIEPRVIHAH